MAFFVGFMIIWFAIDILLAMTAVLGPGNSKDGVNKVRVAYIAVELAVLMWALTLFKGM